MHGYAIIETVDINASVLDLFDGFWAPEASQEIPQIGSPCVVPSDREAVYVTPVISNILGPYRCAISPNVLRLLLFLPAPSTVEHWQLVEEE